MSHARGLRRLLHIDRGAAGVDRAIDDELAFHFQMTIDELVAAGRTPDEARREAEQRFGDIRATKHRLGALDRARATQRSRAIWWDNVVHDFRYALRGLRRSPGFALGVIVTLALGIGANATMFGIVDRLMFRPPANLIAPERAARVYFTQMRRGRDDVSSYTGYRRYLDLRHTTRSFDAMTPYASRRLAVGRGEGTTEMSVAESGADLWRLFDVKPVIGRFFDEHEDSPPDGTHVAVLSYALWQSRYGGKNTVLGATIELGAGTYTIIGVAPAGFNAFDLDPVVAFVPIVAATADSRPGDLVHDPTHPWYDTYTWSWLEVFARRKADVSLPAANAELTAAFRLSHREELARTPASIPDERRLVTAVAGPVLADRGPNEGRDAKIATWLAGVSAIVLLVACANVANLLLSRALRRRREIAVRMALGVSRGRLIAQLLTETTVLSLLGGALGLAIGQTGGAVLRAVLLRGVRDTSLISDHRVLLVALALTLACALLTGVAPLMHIRGADLAPALKAGARDGVISRSRVRSVLLIAQAALSVVLLVGAGLFIRSVGEIRAVSLGYDPDRIMWVNVETRGVPLDSVQRIQLLDQLTQQASTLPGVQSAARALSVPFWDSWQYGLTVPGIDSVARLGDFILEAAGPRYFQTVGTRILRGRGFADGDRARSPLVVVVDAAMATRLWPGADALGKCVKIGADTMPCRTVVGIAEDVRARSLSTVDLHYYVPIAQFQPSPGGVFVRTQAGAASASEAVRRALQAVMPGASYVTITPISSVVASQTRAWRIGAIMFAAFGGLALVLAAIGLYSVIAFNVTQRTHEIGVRVALGAEIADVIGLVLRDGLRTAVPGLAFGTLLALVAGHWIGPLLFQVSANDPAVYAAVGATLLVVALIASWIPARRAAGVDPTEALRVD